MKQPIEKFERPEWIDKEGNKITAHLTREQEKINELIDRVNELYDNRK